MGKETERTTEREMIEQSSIITFAVSLRSQDHPAFLIKGWIRARKRHFFASKAILRVPPCKDGGTILQTLTMIWVILRVPPYEKRRDDTAFYYA